MNGALQSPTFTGIDAATQGAAGLLYLIVGVGAWLKSPVDSRTRVFLGVALANALAFAAQAAAWLSGQRELFQLPRAALGALLVGLTVGSLLLFHFCQVFPWRRPWIRRFGGILPPAYGLLLLATVAPVLLVPPLPPDLGAISPVLLVGAFAVGLPLLIVVGVVLPLAAIVSLVKSFREAAAPERRPMRVPLAWLLVSQIGGGTIGLIFAPVLAVLAPGAAVLTALTMAVWFLGLMTPVGFALAVWKYDLPAAAST